MGVGLSMFSMLGYGSYLALNEMNLIPDYRTPKQKAKKRLDDEIEATTRQKAACPELYPEPVDFYVKDFKEAYDKAEDK